MFLNKGAITCKKQKIIHQYKSLPYDLNLVGLKARCNLNQINLILQQKEKERQKKKNKDIEVKKVISDNDYLDSDERNKIDNNNNMDEKIKESKSNSFLCPSSDLIKKIKNFQIWNKNKILKQSGFQGYFNSLVPNSNIVKIIKNKINDQAGLNSNFYICPQIANKTTINFNNKRKISSALLKYTKYQTCDLSSKMKRTKDGKSKTNRFIRLNKPALNLIQKKVKRVMSAPKIDWKEKKRKWKEKNKNVAEEDYRFYLDRPLSPRYNDKSVKLLPKGGGVLYSNSIWRTKKINDLVPKLCYNALCYLKDFKRKRKEIIYRKEKKIAYDLTFLSNRLVLDDRYYVY